MTEENINQFPNEFGQEHRQISQEEGWVNNLWFSVWVWEPVWWWEEDMQKVWDWLWLKEGWQGKQAQEKKKIEIADIILLLWVWFFVFTLYSVMYFFQWDYIFSIIWLLVFISLFKMFIVSKKQNNNLAILLWLFLLWIYLYFLTYYISFWNFVLPMFILTFIVIFITYYSNITFDFNTKKPQEKLQQEEKPQEEPQQQEENDDWKVQLWEDIVNNYNNDFSVDVNETITNEIADRVIWLLSKWYNILFSPNTKKIFEFFTIVKTEEVIYPEWLIIWDTWNQFNKSNDEKLDNEEENSILEDKDNDIDDDNDDEDEKEKETEEDGNDDDDDDGWDF